MKRVFLIILLSLLWFDCIAEVITHNEKRLIYDILELNDLDSTSLNFLKDWVSDTKFKIPIVIEILNNPMTFPDFVNDIETILERQDTEEILEFFSSVLYETDSSGQSFYEEFREYFFKNVKKPKDIFSYVELVWGKADYFLMNSLSELNEIEKKQLEYLSTALHMESEDSLKYKNYYLENEITEYSDLEMDEYETIIEKINFKEMMISALIFQTGFNILIENLGDKEFKWKRKIEKFTPFGNLCIGTKKADIYEKKYSFILDPGGDDIYQTSISTDLDNPYFWIVDLNGNDNYINFEIAELFRVLFGLGAHFDTVGNDIYQGGDYSFSSFFGYFNLQDKSGNDIYYGGLHSLGASTFGISILLDEDGSDIYKVTELGEGFAGTLAAGLLVDYKGNDLYYAGGKYLHKPLAPMDFRSLSQGFGFGVRPDMAGGIGVLYDGEGNDRYDGGVYAQAVAYWYALGIIIDRKGNDFYNAVYYPQGSGIHLAGGFLLDEEGEDHYYSKHGPGQGAAHDYAVGFLVDREGDDSYSVEGGNGLALTNSVGIFLDVSGNDRYERKNQNSYGYSNISRDTGGIGIFLDTGGEDSYPIERCKNDTIWKSGTYGVGLDTLIVIPKEIIKEIAEQEAAEIDSLADIEEIFGIASEWGVGSAVERVNKAGEILLKRDHEAAEYIYENQLGTKGGLVYRAIKKYAQKSEEFKKYIPEALHHQDSLWVKNTIGLIGDLQDTTYIDTLKIFLVKNKYIPNILSALGKMKTDKSTIILKEFINSPSEKYRVITARGLKKINSPYSRELLLEMGNDPSFLIKTMVRLMKKDNIEK